MMTLFNGEDKRGHAGDIPFCPLGKTWRGKGTKEDTPLRGVLLSPPPRLGFTHRINPLEYLGPIGWAHAAGSTDPGTKIPSMFF